MQYDDEIARLYQHISFTKRWSCGPDVMYFMGQADAIVAAMCQIPAQPSVRKRLLSVSLQKGAQATTAIEGNTLTDAEVAEVAQGNTLPPSKQYQEREVRNILDAMNGLLSAVAGDGQSQLITPELIKEFHRNVGRELGEHFEAIPGQFRTDSRHVGAYKCPQPEHVEELVSRLCRWLAEEFGFATNQQTFADALVQAIVTHVYLEWIHPFGDGNGRTGRLLEFYILLRAGNPDIGSHILSNFYNETRPEYYRQLDQAGKTRDLTAFIKYAVQGYCDGLRKVMNDIAESNLEVAWRELVHARFAERSYRKKGVFKRRRRLALALGPDQRGQTTDDIMMLTPDLAREYAVLTERTLLRDLDELKQMDIVVEERGRYRLNLGLLGPQMPKRRQSAGLK